MKLRNFFMGLGILPVVLIISVLLARPVYAAGAMVSTAVHVLVLVHAPTGETKPVALYPTLIECKSDRDALQEEADALAPRVFFAVCLPLKST